MKASLVSGNLPNNVALVGPRLRQSLRVTADRQRICRRGRYIRQRLERALPFCGLKCFVCLK